MITICVLSALSLCPFPLVLFPQITDGRRPGPAASVRAGRLSVVDFPPMAGAIVPVVISPVMPVHGPADGVLARRLFIVSIATVVVSTATVEGFFLTAMIISNTTAIASCTPLIVFSVTVVTSALMFRFSAVETATGLGIAGVVTFSGGVLSVTA